MEARHSLNFDTYEEGKLTIEEYLGRVVFYQKRAWELLANPRHDCVLGIQDFFKTIPGCGQQQIGAVAHRHGMGGPVLLLPITFAFAGGHHPWPCRIDPKPPTD